MNNLEKIASAISSIGKAFTEDRLPSHIREVASLGALAAPSAYRLATGKTMDQKKSDALEVGGLASLAAPYVLKMRH